MPKPNRSYTAGANAARKLIIAKLRRELKAVGHGSDEEPAMIDGRKFYNWVLSMDSRYGRRKGGLGRK